VPASTVMATDLAPEVPAPARTTTPGTTARMPPCATEKVKIQGCKSCNPVPTNSISLRTRVPASTAVTMDLAPKVPAPARTTTPGTIARVRPCAAEYENVASAHLHRL